MLDTGWHPPPPKVGGFLSVAALTSRATGGFLLRRGRLGPSRSTGWHGLPGRQNVQRRIMAGVTFKSAGRTFEFRLRWPVCSVYASTMAACLTGILRWNKQQSSAKPCQLVGKLPPEPKPALIQYGLVQSRFYTHIFPRQKFQLRYTPRFANMGAPYIPALKGEALRRAG